jgi:hypothetical protein
MVRVKPKTHRLQALISLQTWAYLEILAEKGTYGLSVPDVARNLLDAGVRNAQDRGDLTQEDRAKVEGRER